MNELVRETERWWVHCASGLMYVCTLWAASALSWYMCALSWAHWWWLSINKQTNKNGQSLINDNDLKDAKSDVVHELRLIEWSGIQNENEQNTKWKHGWCARSRVRVHSPSGWSKKMRKISEKSLAERGTQWNLKSLPGWSCQWYMLVSKTKPCKSKYKLFWRRNCEWLGKTAIISSVMSLLTDNRSNSRANTC